MNDEVKDYLKTATPEDLISILKFHEEHVDMVKQEIRARGMSVVYSALGIGLVNRSDD